jgi:predicted nuclease of predicted toxin-antitoxin system
MKILLDECVDRRFGRELEGHVVRTVPQMNWAGIKNGELMALAAANFDIFITVDRNLSYQHDISKFDIAMLVIHSVSNRLEDLKPFAKLVIASLDAPVNGSATVLSLELSD